MTSAVIVARSPGASPPAFDLAADLAGVGIDVLGAARPEDLMGRSPPPGTRMCWSAHEPQPDELLFQALQGVQTHAASAGAAVH
jgi:hypothetical protein